MIFSLFRRQRAPDPGMLLYIAIAASARDPALYLDLGVPDTLDGRLEALMLLAALAVERLSREAGDPARGRLMARGVSEAFFDDMDRTLRETGVSDIGIPKKVRKLARNFYGRLQALAAALASDDDAGLADVLGRNFFAGEAAVPDGFGKMPGYVRRFYAQLAATGLDALDAGRLDAAAQPHGRTEPLKERPE